MSKKGDVLVILRKATVSVDELPDGPWAEALRSEMGRLQEAIQSTMTDDGLIVRRGSRKPWEDNQER
jgi:hypothetical protein